MRYELPGTLLRISHDGSAFDSAASFIAAFRRQFGVTPIVFRKRDEWPFEDMIPRYDYLARVAKLDCRLIRCSIDKPIMSSVNIAEVTQNIQPAGLYSMLITNVKYDEEFITNSDVMLSYALCIEENQTSDKLDWISITLNENIDNLTHIQKGSLRGFAAIYWHNTSSCTGCFKD